MRWLNLNTFHNGLSIVLGVVGVIMTFDWQLLGLTPQQMGTILAVCMLVKLVANAVRDGLTGMVKEQPPVADQMKTVVVAAPSDATIQVDKYGYVEH